MEEKLVHVWVQPCLVPSQLLEVPGSARGERLGVVVDLEQ